MAGDPIDHCVGEVLPARNTVENEEVARETAAAKSLDPAQAQQTGPAKEPGYAIHLWIEGLFGENPAAHHKEWIVALAYRQSMHRQTAVNRALQPTIEIEKNLDRASPSLYHAVHIGRMFDRVIVEVCRDTDRSERFLKIEMSDAVIREIRLYASASSGSSRPVETIILEYQRIQWTYTKLRQQDAQREGHSSSSWTRTVVAPKSKPRSRKDGRPVVLDTDEASS
jgi:type VI secretion system Hcp family effector